MSQGAAHIRTILATAVQEGVVPGVVVLASAAGQIRLCEFAGHSEIQPSSRLTHRHTVWDLASLTKPLVTSLLVMQAIAKGVLDLDEPIGAAPAATPPATARAMTVRLALAHAAGLPSHLPFWSAALGPQGQGAGSPAARAAVVTAAGRAALAYPPGARSIYSDLGFILLGDLLERRWGDRLDHLAAAHLGPPFGSPTLDFRPVEPHTDQGTARDLGADPAADPGSDIAASEACPVRQRLLRGEVHDLNAYAMGGVAGHAGLFGTADSVAAVAHELLAAYRGTGVRAGTRPLVDPKILRQFWTPAGIPGSTWRLGWDGPSPQQSLAGDRIARTAVGHLAFTGCSLWIDPEREAFVLMLSNRVHPTVRDDPRFRDLRRAANDAALDAIGYRA
jgi:CubicO group peptidase (beta-lactamase class C family)